MLNKIKLNIVNFNRIGILKKKANSGGNTPIEKPIGVYIYTTDKEFITADDWDTANNDKAVGVFVNDGEHDFVIAKVNARSSSAKWGGYNKLLTSIPAIKSQSSAELDFNGQENTLNIIQELNGYEDEKGTIGAPAAEACANYTFPDGTKGYLPALGEWNLAHLNKAEVDNALLKCGGINIFPSAYYWSSTQDNANYSWELYWDTGNTYSAGKNNKINVRAFCKI